MPYKLSAPPATIKNLPKGAQKIWIETFNAVERDTKDEDKARQAAWSNVKNEYRKAGDKWVPKADLEGLAEISLVITKASLQKDGTMRWCATCSDTGPDRTGEATSLDLFKDWIERAEGGQTTDFLPPPRVPFLGLSHYPSFEGDGEAGVTEKMYVDGKQFKAAGVFRADHPLGQALFEAVRAELDTVKKGGQIEQPIRISAAWWDLGHSHGRFTFTRRSLTETCPMCAQGTDNKVYRAGQLDHFAATRVPINPRTELGLEEKSMAKTTRKDDAASIVGDELAEELEGKAQELVGKSETEEAEALVIKAEETESSVSSETSDQAEEPDSEKAATKADVEKMYSDDGLPFGGATTIAGIEAHIAEQEKMDQLYNNWDMFTAALGNILQSPIEGRMEAIKALANEFGDRVETIKANVSDAFLVARAMVSATSHPASVEVEKGDNIVTDEVETTEQPEAQPESNDPSTLLGTSVQAALSDPSLTRDGKLEAIQEALNDYAGTVKAQLDVVAPPALGEEIVSAIEKSMGSLAEKLDLLIVKLDQRPVQPTALPQQKSYAPSGPVQPQAGNDKPPVSPFTGEPSSLRAMIERSVGMHQ